MTAAQTVTIPNARRPRDDEIDLHGLTHPGRVRSDNQDHFLLCALRKEVVVQMTSLPAGEYFTGESERLASLLMVADGVGGAAKGEVASRLALEAVTQYVSRCTRCYYAASADDEFYDALREAAGQGHAELLRRGQEDSNYRGMATTLTLFLGVWPRGYLLQAGDSRCYLLRHGELDQITRDQTMAQEMVDLGVMSQEEAARTPLAHTLSSSIGGRQTDPKVTRIDLDWGHVLLLCSDGLTRHVTDERIGEVLRSMTTSREACEHLLEEALEGGGSDNITIVVGRALRKES